MSRREEKDASEMSELEKIVLAHLQQWEDVKEEIRVKYANRDASVHALLQAQIENYETLVTLGGTFWNEAREEEWYVFGPLNEAERIEFVKSKYKSHYAYVQLNALFEELRKKAAMHFAKQARLQRKLEKEQKG